MIRFAKPDDCAAMLAIYAPYIETTITFEQEVPSREAFSLRIADVQREYPWIVWEENGRARAFYAKHGFVHVGDYAFQTGSQIDRDLIMRREL